MESTTLRQTYRRRCRVLFLLTIPCQHCRHRKHIREGLDCGRAASMASWDRLLRNCPKRFCSGSRRWKEQSTHQLDLTEEGIDLLPARQDALFFLWEVHGYCVVVCLRRRGGVMIFWSWADSFGGGAISSTALSIVHLDLTHPCSAAFALCTVSPCCTSVCYIPQGPISSTTDARTTDQACPAHIS